MQIPKRDILPIGYFAAWRHNLLFSGWLLGIAALLGACASAPPVAPPKPPIYPAPPDEGRFIYERTLQTNEDVAQSKGWARLEIFATGKLEDLKGIVKPYGVAVHQGRVYVTDTAQQLVLLFDIPGNRFLQFGDQGAGKLQKPIGLTISAAGELYVADAEARWIQVYDLDGHYLRTIGNATQLRRPTDVALSVDAKKLYVVDIGGVDNQDHRVQVFDAKSGVLLQTIGRRGEGPGEFNLPVQCTVGPDGTLYVVDGGNFRVEAFSPDGKFLFQFGEPGRYPGQFARPKGIATDPEGNIYVVDAAFGNAQIFNSKGQILMFIGNRGNANGPGKFDLPAGIAVGEDGRVYIVDQYFRKVDVFRPLSTRHTG